jgi:carbonic anhydrase
MYQNLQKKGSTMNADQALKLLLDGNKRFVNGNRSYPHQDSRRIQDLAQGQYPWATILSCSDSRVPPEHIFDVGLGDLFIVRVAGNICGEIEIGSLEYAVEHLSDVLNKITPTVARTMQQDPKLSGSRLITAVVHENVWQSIEDILRYSSVIRNSVRDQRVSLVGSLYHIEKGSVDWLGPHPRQKHLVATSSSPIDPGGKIPLWKGMFSSSSRYR